MKLRQLQLAITAVCVAGAMVAPRAFAYVGLDGTINFGSSAYENGTGGEFNAVTTPFGSSPDLGSFPTFCIEDSENISAPPSGPYTYTINPGAVAGGAGAYAIDPHTGLTMDNISIGTAWLFSQFAAGTLTLDDGSGGAGSYFGANRYNNAGELQQAFWYLEDENGGVDNGYVALAESALSTDLNGVKADSGGAYGVVALNLFNPDGSLAQDQLAVVPEPIVPEPTTAGCFLLGLGALVCFQRFSHKKHS